MTDSTGRAFDYRRKKGVLDVSILAPQNTPAWINDPAKLWRAAEAADTRVNSRTARELLVALPAELSDDQRAVLAREIGQMLVDRYRVAVMVAVHAPDKKGDQRNHHAHILMTTRAITPDGFGGKVRVLDDKKTGPVEVEIIRAAVAEFTNRYLERAGVSARVDHRTLVAQSEAAEQRGDIAAAVMLAREPTKREDRTTIEARRRGEDPAGSAWNDDVRIGNAHALANFLATAQAEGRVIETPSRSDFAQAKIDRAREATNEINKTPLEVPAPTIANRTPRVRPSVGRGMRHRLGTRIGSASRAEGKDAAVLNAAAAQSSELRRAQGEMSQKYIDMIQEIVAEFGQRAIIAVDYARRLQWPIADARMLAQHQIRDPGCDVLLQHGIRADNAWRRALTLAERRRSRYGDAMVAAVSARQAFERLEVSEEPSRWKQRTRREWAELRRRQRAGLERTHRRELRAHSLVSDQAMVYYTNKVRTAKDALGQTEGKRRARYPVPGDALRTGTTVPTARIQPRSSIDPFGDIAPESSVQRSQPYAASPRRRSQPGA